MNLFHTDAGLIVLFFVALFAAFVNGALGYGFSSLTVPIALLFFSNRTLAPALVLVELGINSWLLILNRRSLAAVRTRALPILLGLVPGVLAGSYLLTSMNPASMKFWTYLVLLPLILAQAAGFRRPLRSEHRAGVTLGAAVGTLYATTTISGPPLAMMFNNQGLEQEEFRAALGSVRIVETTLTAISYFFLGLFRPNSLALAVPIAPAVLLGLPLGASFIRYIRTETFRRICMSFDAWIVGFGLSRAIIDLALLPTRVAYAVWCAIIIFDACLLYQYFASGRFRAKVEPFSSVAKRRASS